MTFSQEDNSSIVLQVVIKHRTKFPGRWEGKKHIVAMLSVPIPMVKGSSFVDGVLAGNESSIIVSARVIGLRVESMNVQREQESHLWHAICSPGNGLRQQQCW